jgi:hypothetical protein
MRRTFLARVLALPALGMSAAQQPPAPRKMKVLIKSAWGSADPTQAAYESHRAQSPDSCMRVREGPWGPGERRNEVT